MSECDRSQIFEDIDFCRGRIPVFFAKYSDGPKSTKQAYKRMLEVLFIMLDAAVTRLLILEGLEPLPPDTDPE